MGKTDGNITVIWDEARFHISLATSSRVRSTMRPHLPLYAKGTEQTFTERSMGFE